MHITPQAMETMPTTTKTEMGSLKIATAPAAASMGATPRAIGYATVMSDCSKDLIKESKYSPCTATDAINQRHAFVGRGTKNAAGARIMALNPSIRARRDILSLPAFRMALTTAWAKREMRMRIEAEFSTVEC